MFTLETEAVVTADGEMQLRARMPSTVSPGLHKVVIVVEEEAAEPYTEEERKRHDALSAGIDWQKVAARSVPPQSWFDETEDPFALPGENR